MNCKEKLDTAFKFIALIIFAFLANKAIEQKNNHPLPFAMMSGGAFPIDGEMEMMSGGPLPLHGENVFMMEMGNGMIKDGENLDVQVEKKIIDGEEKVEIRVNGEVIEAQDFEALNLKEGSSGVMKWKVRDGGKGKKGKMHAKRVIMKKMDSHAMCEDCQELGEMCEDCKNKE